MEEVYRRKREKGGVRRKIWRTKKKTKPREKKKGDWGVDTGAFVCSNSK